MEGRKQRACRPNLRLNLQPRTRCLTAETRDPKVFLAPANYPVSGFPCVMSLCLG
jgi:hypothetical protein